MKMVDSASNNIRNAIGDNNKENIGCRFCGPKTKMLVKAPPPCPLE